MGLFGNKYKEEIEVLKKIIADKDELLQYKDRTSEYMDMIIDKIKESKHNPSAVNHAIDTFIPMNLATIPNKSTSDSNDKLEREIKSLKFKLSNSEKKNKSLLSYKSIDNRFELIQKLYFDIDKFIQEEEGTFERRVESTLVHSKILEDGYMFGKDVKKMRNNVTEILRALYGYEYISSLPTEADIQDTIESIDKVDNDAYGHYLCKEFKIEDFVDKYNNCGYDINRAVASFTLNNEKYIKIATDATLCELFRKFTLRSIKLNTKVKLLLETIKDTLVLMNDKYDVELTKLSIENKKLKDNINQLVSDDKDKTIRELQREIASLRIENEALRYKKEVK